MRFLKGLTAVMFRITLIDAFSYCAVKDSFVDFGQPTVDRDHVYDDEFPCRGDDILIFLLVMRHLSCNLHRTP